ASCPAVSFGATGTASRTKSNEHHVRREFRLIGRSSRSSCSLLGDAGLETIRLHTASCLGVKKQNAYQRREFSDVVRNRCLGSGPATVRAIADKFLAGALWAVGHEAIIFRKSRARSGTRARSSTLRTEAHLESHGREAGGAPGRPDWDPAMQVIGEIERGVPAVGFDRMAEIID